MTDSDDFSSTRPISVAELLAKNGSIGAPPVGGRRRRRRGNSDAVSVAELTGEIPIVNTGSFAAQTAPKPVEDDAAVADVAAPAVAPAADAEPVDIQPETQPDVEAQVQPDVQPDEAEADYDAYLQERTADAGPVEFVAPQRKRLGRWSASKTAAEEMRPDPVDDADVIGTDEDDADLFALTGAAPAEFDTDDEPKPDLGAASRGRDRSRASFSSGYDTLFGGFAADTAVAHQDAATEVADYEYPDEEPGERATDAPEHHRSGAVQGLWSVGQSILAVAFGAGMFFAFDQLWKWNMIVALVLSGLVILGLVAGVRVVRKSHDLSSTLIAMLVGGMVTFGPLALLLAR